MFIHGERIHEVKTANFPEIDDRMESLVDKVNLRHFTIEVKLQQCRCRGISEKDGHWLIRLRHVDSLVYTVDPVHFCGSLGTGGLTKADTANLQRQSNTYTLGEGILNSHVLNGPRQANLVLIAYASSEGSGEPAHPRSLARTSAARS